MGGCSGGSERPTAYHDSGRPAEADSGLEVAGGGAELPGCLQHDPDVVVGHGH